MFDKKWMEMCTRVHWTVPLILFVPVVLTFIGLSIFYYEMAWYAIPGLIVAGIFAWTFAEYVLHRFVFHWQPPGKIGERIHFMFHGVHHDYPNDSNRLVMVPSLSIPLAFAFYFGFRLLIGEAYVAPFFSGFVIGYLMYDMTHYAVHHARWNNKYFLALKKHHMKHHYQDPDHGYGVSNFIWDTVFQSHFPEKPPRKKNEELKKSA